MSFLLLLLRMLHFTALPVTRVRAGPFLGISLKFLHPGLPETLLPFKKGNKTPWTRCFVLLFLLRLPGSESWGLSPSLWGAPSLLLGAQGFPSHPSATSWWLFVSQILALLGQTRVQPHGEPLFPLPSQGGNAPIAAGGSH